MTVLVELGVWKPGHPSVKAELFSLVQKRDLPKHDALYDRASDGIVAVEVGRSQLSERLHGVPLAAS